MSVLTENIARALEIAYERSKRCQPAGFGKLWGCSDTEPMFVDAEGRGYWLWRKGQRCRFYDALGVQYGPEHANVVPAVIWAVSHGLSDLRDPIGTMLMRDEIAANTVRPERGAA